MEILFSCRVFTLSPVSPFRGGKDDLPLKTTTHVYKMKVLFVDGQSSFLACREG